MERPPNPENVSEFGNAMGQTLASAAVMAKAIPLAYLITLTCYGTRLHGDEFDSVDRDHNIPGTPFLPPNPVRVASEERRRSQKPYVMNGPRRDLVLKALQQVCSYRGWTLWAAHVRTQHVHLVVAAEDGPEKVLHDVKAYATRALNHFGREDANTRRWARHGSTRYLWKPEQIGAAIHYVVREQGGPMAVWESSERSP